jgi:ureidoglycolate lyase
MPQITVGDHVLTPVVATAESLSGYGWIMGQPAGVERGKIDFYGHEVRVTNPAEFKSNDDTTLNLVNFTQRPYEVRWMEYHTKHTQTFIPLAGKPFYMVLGKPTQRRPDGSWDECQKSQPDQDDVKAFYFDGSGGLLCALARGTRCRFPSLVIQILLRFSPMRRTTI